MGRAVKSSDARRPSNSDPQLVELDVLNLPVPPRRPGRNHIPGYELNANVGARIAFEDGPRVGYDLSFGLGGEAEHRHKTTISVILLESN